MGSLVAYITDQATAGIKRAALAYALMAISVLIAIFALGYAIDAGHTALALRYGLVKASLMVGAAFLVGAVGCGLTAHFINQRPRVGTSRASSPYSHPPFPKPYSRQLMAGVGIGLLCMIGAAAFLVRARRREVWRERGP